jgi:hypothetical protein
MDKKQGRASTVWRKYIVQNLSIQGSGLRIFCIPCSEPMAFECDHFAKDL